MYLKEGQPLMMRSSCQAFMVDRLLCQIPDSYTSGLMK